MAEGPFAVLAGAAAGREVALVEVVVGTKIAVGKLVVAAVVLEEQEKERRLEQRVAEGKVPASEWVSVSCIGTARMD